MSYVKKKDEIITLAHVFEENSCERMKITYLEQCTTQHDFKSYFIKPQHNTINPPAMGLGFSNWMVCYHCQAKF